MLLVVVVGLGQTDTPGVCPKPCHSRERKSWATAIPRRQYQCLTMRMSGRCPNQTSARCELLRRTVWPCFKSGTSLSSNHGRQRGWAVCIGFRCGGANESYTLVAFPDSGVADSKGYALFAVSWQSGLYGAAFRGLHEADGLLVKFVEWRFSECFIAL